MTGASFPFFNPADRQEIIKGGRKTRKEIDNSRAELKELLRSIKSGNLDPEKIQDTLSAVLAKLQEARESSQATNTAASKIKSPSSEEIGAWLASEDPAAKDALKSMCAQKDTANKKIKTSSDGRASNIQKITDSFKFILTNSDNLDSYIKDSQIFARSLPLSIREKLLELAEKYQTHTGVCERVIEDGFYKSLDSEEKSFLSAFLLRPFDLKNYKAPENTNLHIINKREGFELINLYNTFHKQKDNKTKDKIIAYKAELVELLFSKLGHHFGRASIKNPTRIIPERDIAEILLLKHELFDALMDVTEQTLEFAKTKKAFKPKARAKMLTIISRLLERNRVETLITNLVDLTRK